MLSVGHRRMKLRLALESFANFQHWGEERGVVLFQIVERYLSAAIEVRHAQTFLPSRIQVISRTNAVGIVVGFASCKRHDFPHGLQNLVCGVVDQRCAVPCQHACIKYPPTPWRSCELRLRNRAAILKNNLLRCKTNLPMPKLSVRADAVDQGCRNSEADR